MAKLKFRPLHDRVVVKRVTAEEKTKGGIIIPDTAKEKPQEGEVRRRRPGRPRRERPASLQSIFSHDRVLFGDRSGPEVKLEATSS